MERLKSWLKTKGCRICTAIVCIALVFNACKINCGAQKARVVYSSSGGGEKRIALTFDDGPHPKHTGQILDILKSEGVKATFFVVGENVKYYPDVLDRIISEGHEVGNHTDHHTFLSGLDGESIMEAVDGCDDAIYHHDEYTTRLLRPPGGRYDTNLLQFCAQRDYTVVLWSIDTRDWAGTPASDMEKNVFQNVKDGDIILMHDYVTKCAHTEEALKSILPRLKQMGYSFVTVSELIEN